MRSDSGLHTHMCVYTRAHTHTRTRRDATRRLAFRASPAHTQSSAGHSLFRSALCCLCVSACECVCVHVCVSGVLECASRIHFTHTHAHSQQLAAAARRAQTPSCGSELSSTSASGAATILWAEPTGAGECECVNAVSFEWKCFTARTLLAVCFFEENCWCCVFGCCCRCCLCGRGGRRCAVSNVVRPAVGSDRRSADAER